MFICHTPWYQKVMVDVMSIPISSPKNDEDKCNKGDTVLEKVLKNKKELSLIVAGTTFIIGLLWYIFSSGSPLTVPKPINPNIGTLTVVQVGDFPYRDKNLTLKDFLDDPDVHFKKEYPIERVVGIVNKGNSCYGNSTIQMLYRVPAVRSIIKNLDFYLERIKSNVSTLNSSEKETKMENLKILEGLNNVFYQLDNNSSNNPAILNGKSLQCFPNEFAACGQQDVQEYTTMLFKAFQAVILPNQYSEHFEILIDEEKYVKYIDQRRKRENVEYSKESHNTLALKISPEHEEEITLEKLLDNFMNEEFDAEENGEVIGARHISRKFCHLPDILPLFISRNKYDVKTKNMSKLNTQVKDAFNRVNINSFMSHFVSSSQANILDVTLNLIMFVLHIGGANGGHYVSYVLHDQEWFLINDGTVIQMKSIEEVKRASELASFLYYKVNKK